MSGLRSVSEKGYRTYAPEGTVWLSIVSSGPMFLLTAECGWARRRVSRIQRSSLGALDSHA